MSDSYLLNIGWLFFGAWAVVVVVVSIKAFGPDLFPARAHSRPKQDAADPIRH